jgi:hypothetical protein
MSPRLTAALADCLDQIEAGVPPAAALAACPEDLRADLARLVETSRALRTLPPHPPRAAFRANLQAELAGLESTTVRRRKAWEGGPIVEPVLRRFGRPAGGTAWAARWLAALGVVALLLVSTVAVSANSRPGDRLFTVKRLVAWVWPAFGGADGQFGIPNDADADGETSGETGSKTSSEPAAAPLTHAPTVIARRGRVDREKQVSRASSKDASSSKGTGSLSPSEATGTGAVSAAARPSTTMPAVAPIAPPATADPAILPTAIAPAITPAPGTNPPDSGSPRDPRPGNPPPGGDPQQTPTPASTPTEPPATPSPQPSVVGDFSVSGQIKRLDGSPEGQPLAGAEVQLFRLDRAPDCALGPGAALGSQVTAADGGYRFEALTAGTYLVAAARPRDGGDPECLPLRWHVRGGPAVPGLCDALPSAFTLDDATPGRAWTNIHVLFDGDARCGGVE